MNLWERPNFYSSTGIFTLIPFLGRGRILGHPMGTSPPSKALGRGQDWVPDPASSAGTQGRNVPFGKGVGESAIRTTVSVANGDPSMLPSWR